MKSWLKTLKTLRPGRSTILCDPELRPSGRDLDAEVVLRDDLIADFVYAEYANAVRRNHLHVSRTKFLVNRMQRMVAASVSNHGLWEESERTCL